MPNAAHVPISPHHGPHHIAGTGKIEDLCVLQGLSTATPTADYAVSDAGFLRCPSVYMLRMCIHADIYIYTRL